MKKQQPKQGKAQWATYVCAECDKRYDDTKLRRLRISICPKCEKIAHDTKVLHQALWKELNETQDFV